MYVNTVFIKIFNVTFELLIKISTIPTTYDEVYECTLAESDDVYDEIWDKGFLECELEEYPVLGKMTISVIYK